MQQLNAQLSQSQPRRNSVLPGTPGRGTPVPGTPRGVFLGSGGVLGMSAEDLALDSLKEKEPAQPEPVTKTKRTWWGGKKTVTIERQPSTLSTYRDVEAGPEARRTMLLAPIYNGLAAGLSICE